MLNNKYIFIVVLALIASNLYSQNNNLTNNADIKKSLEKDIMMLASDSFNGREAGTIDEIHAREYIISRFKEIGLLPILPDKSYSQHFEFADGTRYDESTILTINDKRYKLYSDFYPISYSGSGEIKAEVVNVANGISAPEIKYSDYMLKKDLKDKIFLIEMALPSDSLLRSKLSKYTDLQSRIDTAIAKGAKAVIFINSDKKIEKPSKKLSKKIAQSSIPVIFAEGMAYKCLLDASKSEVFLKVEIKKMIKNGYNVIGFIDNKCENTVVIGAHYDHLGLGFDNSLKPEMLETHNGADDNASGVSGMLVLADYLKNTAGHKNNYLFVAFSAEEKGLHGSGYFTKSNDFDIKKINFYINLDMIGRLDKEKNTLSIIGTGTSPTWDSIIKTMPDADFKIKTTPSGMGGSDHTSFYTKNIPVLFFFTGTHPDYHKPTDDYNLINYDGETNILRYIETLIDKADKAGKLSFEKTKDSSVVVPKMSVTLGVVPDHSFSGKGFRIEGTIEGKTAAKAGLKSGDIVLKIDDYEIEDIMIYMKILSKYKKGDKSNLLVLREGKSISVEVIW